MKGGEATPTWQSVIGKKAVGISRFDRLAKGNWLACAVFEHFRSTIYSTPHCNTL